MEFRYYIPGLGERPEIFIGCIATHSLGSGKNGYQAESKNNLKAFDHKMLDLSAGQIVEDCRADWRANCGPGPITDSYPALLRHPKPPRR